MANEYPTEADLAVRVKLGLDKPTATPKTEKDEE